jgi:hypothetical protein
MSAAAFDARNAVKASKEAAFKSAIAWCNSNGKGARVCLRKNEEWSNLIGPSPGALHKRLQ